MHGNCIYTLICDVYECVKWGFMLKKGENWVCIVEWETAGTIVLKENRTDKRKQLEPFMVRIPAVCCFFFIRIRILRS